ncbi:MAG: ABC transporter permease subunit [Acidobacteria bacterium]|nr:ABC transporter permease subunit [Acidobacteriota bacterium]
MTVKRVYPIFKREFGSYFVSPVAYIVISIFLILAGWFFFSTFFLYNQAELRNFFALLPLLFAFIIPAITMGLVADELNVGTYETLLTLPVTVTDVVLGKFFAALAFCAIMLVPTLAYAVSIAFLGDLDPGPVIGGFIGALFLAGAFAAIGIFASSLTKNQIIAFIIGTAICFVLTLIDKMLFFLPDSMLGFFQYMGADRHFQNIAKGVLDSRDFLYFISVMFLSLYLAALSMREKF